jgi:hypothetical protein
MAAEGKLDLWKTVVAIGGGLIAVGASLMGAHLDRYGLPVLIGGLVLVLLGLALAFEQQHEWRRPPRLPRGADCSHFPLHVDPYRFPPHPHFQELSVGLRRAVYPPDFRVICSAPILKIEANLTEFSLTNEPHPPEHRAATQYHTSIDAVSLLFPPLRAIAPPAVLSIMVFSDERIRVKRIRRLKTKYPQTQASAPPAGPPSSRVPDLPNEGPRVIP